MITTEQAKHIASNPDGCDDSDLHDLLEWIGNGVKPPKKARLIYPAGRKPVRTLQDVRNYCWNALTARGLRKSGKVQTALQYERICDQIYDHLEPYAQW